MTNVTLLGFMQAPGGSVITAFLGGGEDSLVVLDFVVTNGALVVVVRAPEVSPQIIPVSVGSAERGGCVPTSSEWCGFVFMRQQWNGYSTLASLRRLKETTGILYNFDAPSMYNFCNFSKFLPGKWDIFVS